MQAHELARPKIGRYAVLELLEESGDAVTLEAYDPELDRRISLQVVPAPGGDRVAQARALGRVNHPSVATVYEVATVDDRVVISSERVMGRSLALWAAAAGSFNRVFDVLLQAGDGLAAAHAEGVVHGDFGPDAVVVADDGHPRIVGFGRSRGDQAADVAAYCQTVGAVLEGTRIPAGVRAVLERPADTMASLQSALRRALARRRWLVRGALGLVVVLGLVGYALQPAPAPAPCPDAAARLPGVWDDAQREAGRRAFAASSLPYADPTWARVSAAMDRYAHRWVAAHNDACRATRIRGEATEEMLDRRIACLDGARRALRAAARSFAAANEDAIERAIDTVESLPAVAACDDLESLAAIEQPSPDIAEEVEAIREDIARAKTLKGADASDPSFMRAALQRAEELAYPVVEAEAGLVLARRASGPEGLAYGRAAFADAMQGRDDHLAVLIAANLSWNARLLGNPHLAHAWVSVAHGIGAPLTLRPETAARLAWTEGMLARDAGDYEDALRRFDVAVAIAQGADLDTLRLDIETQRAGVFLVRGQLDRAAVLVDATLADYVELYGPGHPRTAVARINAGQVALRRKDNARARAELTAARETLTARFGPQHAKLAPVLNSLGVLALAEGRLDEALELLRSSLAIVEKTEGPDTRGASEKLHNIGLVLVRLGRAPEAIPYARRNADLLASLHGAASWRAIQAELRYALRLGEAGRCEEATQHVGDFPPAPLAPTEEVEGYELIAELLEVCHDEPRRRAVLERAVALVDKGGEQSRAAAGVMHELAELTGDPELARRAAAAFEAIGDEAAAHEVRRILDPGKGGHE